MLVTSWFCNKCLCEVNPPFLTTIKLCVSAFVVRRSFSSSETIKGVKISPLLKSFVHTLSWKRLCGLAERGRAAAGSPVSQPRQGIALYGEKLPRAHKGSPQFQKRLCRDLCRRSGLRACRSQLATFVGGTGCLQQPESGAKDTASRGGEILWLNQEILRSLLLGEDRQREAGGRVKLGEADGTAIFHLQMAILVNVSFQ